MWSGSEEDHAFRSQVIQWLLHYAPTEPPQETVCENPIPRDVVQFWHDLDALPGDVAECLNSWKQLEKDGFFIHLFDDARARCFIVTNYKPSHVAAFDRCYHPAMRCDYFRLCYILRRGGFYVDADEVYQATGCESLFQDDKIKVQALCYDTSANQMVPPEAFLSDTKFPSSRIFYVNNNPIIAPPGHKLVHLALRRATRTLLRGSERPEIQSTTGPGNLSASLVRHVTRLQKSRGAWDFAILRDWNSISECRWFLSYRNDERNWRLLNAPRRY
jgi:mannosyltransferase OCH1-like enzyme